MATTPVEVQRVLEQLEPLLARIYHDGTLGEVAIIAGGHQFQIEERTRRKHGKVDFERDGGRTTPVIRK